MFPFFDGIQYHLERPNSEGNPTVFVMFKVDKSQTLNITLIQLSEFSWRFDQMFFTFIEGMIRLVYARETPKKTFQVHIYVICININIVIYSFMR